MTTATSQMCQRLPELGKNMEDGCMSASAWETESPFPSPSLFSPPPLCVPSPSIFTSITPWSPLASVPQTSLALWYEGTSYTVAELPGETGSGTCSSPMDWKQELANLHFLWCHYTTRHWAHTQPREGNRRTALLCITKDWLVALIPYFLFTAAVTETISWH